MRSEALLEIARLPGVDDARLLRIFQHACNDLVKIKCGVLVIGISHLLVRQSISVAQHERLPRVHNSSATRRQHLRLAVELDVRRLKETQFNALALPEFLPF